MPHVGQELLKCLGRRLADLGEDARGVALRVETVTLGRGDERPEPGMILGGRVVPGEEPGTEKGTRFD